jgi:hypothetical protein
LVQLIKISTKIKHLTDTVSHTAESIQNLVDGIKRAVTPALFGKTITDFVSKFWHNKSKGKGKKDE